ncbi:spore coat protein [Niallia sp. Sow4_A1]|uniref:Spore coat protein n=1 Tax=Niallia hominis TaxID=3133173 RepID=A0ABV1F2L0_9BACI|nr:MULTISPECIES: spore coat protein [Bacillaceae]MCM3364586.1 spore coat protein [Niallia sp. MER TA 168]
MNSIIEYLTGMDALTDQIIATDLLISVKSGIRNYSMAITETVHPEIKEILGRHLDEALDMHERLSSYMAEKGWYHAFEPKEQINLNLQNIDTALNLPIL